MYQKDRLNNELTIFQKVKNLDYTLIVSVILLSIISLFVMYSTDGGEILFHTKNHFIKLTVFFPLMIIVAFFNIKFWHNFSYIIYFIIILLLIWVSFFGIKSSGSQIQLVKPILKASSADTRSDRKYSSLALADPTS